VVLASFVGAGLCSRQCQFDAIGGAYFVEDAGEVMLDGFFADGEPLCDLAVVPPVDDEREHFALAEREAERLPGPDAALVTAERPNDVEQIANQRLVQP